MTNPLPSVLRLLRLGLAKFKRLLRRKPPDDTDPTEPIGLRDVLRLLLPFVIALVLVSVYGPELTPEGARRFSLIAIMAAMGFSILLGQKLLRRWLRAKPKHNIILSAEVAGAFLGSIMTVLLGGFVVNHMLEAAEERGQIRHVVRDHYEAKSRLLDDFAYRGQKVLYYAYAYRTAEEWLMRYEDIEEAINKNPPANETDQTDALPKKAKLPGFGIGRLDRDEAYTYYSEMQRAFVEAGSMHGMCGQIEAMFFDSYRLSNSLMPQMGTADGRLRVLAQTGELRKGFQTEGQLQVQEFIDEMDRFLDPQKLGGDGPRPDTFAEAAEILRERFGVLNGAYTELIRTMRFDLQLARTEHLPESDVGFLRRWYRFLSAGLGRIFR